MLTSQHLGLTLTCVLIIACGAAGADPFLSALMLAGAGIGTILPDIHMKQPGRFRPLTFAWYLVHAGKRICTPVICRFYRAAWGFHISPGDKRLTHSLPGTMLYCLVLAGITGGITVVSSGWIPPGASAALLAGIVMGMFFHLAEDLCTRKGIAIFFPFAETTLHGSIRPCNTADPRINRFHIQHALILAFVLIADLLLRLPESHLLMLCILAAGIANGAMICQSDVRLERIRGQAAGTGDAVIAG